MIHTEWTCQYDQRPVWADSAGKALSKATAEIDDAIVNKIIKDAETSDANNSLMLYTSGTNNMQLEDRTMSTETKLNKVVNEIEGLRKKLNKEARIHCGLVLQADMSPYNDLPKNNHAFLSDAWRDHCKMTERAVDSIHAGEAPEGVEVTVISLPSMFGQERIRMTEELVDAIAEFEDYVEETYAMPLMKLHRERQALQQMRDAERKLENKDNDYLFMTCF